MRYLTLTWAEQREWLDEGVNLYDSCIKLVAAGLSDEKIAEELDYDLPDVQHLIDRARAMYASLCSHAKSKSPADGQTDQTPSDTKPAADQSSPST